MIGIPLQSKTFFETEMRSIVKDPLAFGEAWALATELYMYNFAKSLCEGLGVPLPYKEVLLARLKESGEPNFKAYRSVAQKMIPDYDDNLAKNIYMSFERFFGDLTTSLCELYQNCTRLLVIPLTIDMPLPTTNPTGHVLSERHGIKAESFSCAELLIYTLRIHKDIDLILGNLSNKEIFKGGKILSEDEMDNLVKQKTAKLYEYIKLPLRTATKAYVEKLEQDFPDLQRKR